MTDFTKISGDDGTLQFACGDDASRWATAFCQHAKKLGYSTLDEGWVLGWFANAIEAAHDLRKRRATQREGEATKAAQEIIDALTAMKGKRMAIRFETDLVAEHVGTIIERAGKVARALLQTEPPPSPSTRREEVIEALKPFAAAADHYDDIPGISRIYDNVELWQDGRRIDFITVGDLRRAREVLKSPSPSRKQGGE